MKLDFTDGTTTNIQTKIVELEVQLRLAEDENGFLNLELDDLEKECEKARGSDCIYLNKKIDTKKKEIETSEAKVEMLEREQRYYKQALYQGYIEIVDDHS